MTPGPAERPLRVAPRAVFLDRDGVLNEVVIRDGRPHPPDSLTDLRIYTDVPGSLTRLKQARFALVVVTNQPDVARGAQTREVVEAMNAHLSTALPLDEVRVCYHNDADGCGVSVRPSHGVGGRGAAARSAVRCVRAVASGRRLERPAAGGRARP